MPSIYINETDISGSDQLFISNIYSGKILGEIMRLQDKSITITENGTQEVTFDSGYTGLNKVNITTNVETNPYPIKSVTMNESGNIVVVDTNDNEYTLVPTFDSAGKITSATYNGHTINFTYDADGKLKTVGDVEISNLENYKAKNTGLPIEISASCPSPFLLSQTNIASSPKYIFPTTTASVVKVNESGTEIVAARDFTAYSKNSAATSAFTVSYDSTNDENTISSVGVNNYERIGYSVTLSVGEEIKFATKYKCDGTLQTSGASPNAPFMFVGESTVLDNSSYLYSQSSCLASYTLPITAATYSEYTCSYINSTSSEKTVIVGLDFGGVKDGVTAVTYFQNVRLVKFAAITEVDVGDEVKTALSPANSYATFNYQWQKAGSTPEPPSNMVMTGTGLVATAAGNSFYKVNDGEAIVCLCHDGYTGCLLVSKISSAVTYSNSGGTFTYSTSIIYGGEAWYVSATSYWSGGTHSETSGLGRYVLESSSVDPAILGLRLLEVAFSFTSFEDISGATSSTYTAQTGDNTIRCVLTGTGNAEGTITSSSVTVNEVN